MISDLLEMLEEIEQEVDDALMKDAEQTRYNRGVGDATEKFRELAEARMRQLIIDRRESRRGPA